MKLSQICKANYAQECLAASPELGVNDTNYSL